MADRAWIEDDHEDGWLVYLVVDVPAGGHYSRRWRVPTWAEAERRLANLRKLGEWRTKRHGTPPLVIGAPVEEGELTYTGYKRVCLTVYFVDNGEGEGYLRLMLEDGTYVKVWPSREGPTFGVYGFMQKMLNLLPAEGEGA